MNKYGYYVYEGDVLDYKKMSVFLSHISEFISKLKAFVDNL